jgi:hypothetical protein
MDLVQMFKEVTWNKTISVKDLERNRIYPIFRAKIITTSICASVVLNIRDSLEDPAHVFLPKSFRDVVTDDDIEKINTNAVSLNLMFRGVCSTNKA